MRAAQFWVPDKSGTVFQWKTAPQCWDCLVPGAPPMNVTAVAISPTTIRVTWQPPPAETANGRIAYYKLLCVESGRGDSEATVVKLNQTTFVLDELRRWTEYRIWVLAGTSVGDGPPSYPVTVRTYEDGTCQIAISCWVFIFLFCVDSVLWTASFRYFWNWNLNKLVKILKK